MAGIAEQLRQAVLQAAIQGKLTEQLPEDGDAKDLLAEIQAEKAKLITEKRTKRENPLETIAKDEVPFDVSNSWSWAKLGDLCLKIGAGNTPPGGKNSDVYKTDGIKFIRSMNVYNDGLHYEGMVYISEELASKRAGSAVIAKDMLLNITGGSIGRCAIVPNDFDIGNVNQHVLIIRCVNEQCRSYIHLVICSPLIQAAINEKAVGDKAGFSANKAKNLLIPLPPLAEQHRIVARVDELMAKIDELEKVENELNALHKAFPGDMISYPIPVRIYRLRYYRNLPALPKHHFRSARYPPYNFNCPTQLCAVGSSLWVISLRKYLGSTARIPNRTRSRASASLRIVYSSHTRSLSRILDALRSARALRSSKQ